MKRVSMFLGVLYLSVSVARAQDPMGHEAWVSSERAGTVAVIDGATHKVIAEIAVGKRPRGIHASPDGKLVYVAVSGTPISGPPAGAKAPGAAPAVDDDDDLKNADRSADGVVEIDVATRKVLRKLNVGADPEEFAVSPDGSKLYVSNEDVATASVVDVASGKVQHIVAVKKEPEGVALTPDHKQVYVTCEAGGEIVIFNADTAKRERSFMVDGRPRSIAFTSDGKTAYFPSETTGVVHVVDTATQKVKHDITLPEGARPMCAQMRKGDKELFVSTGRGSTVCVIDVEKNAVAAAIKVGARAWGMAFSPDEKLLYVANGPSNDVSVVDVASRKEIARVKAGDSPWARRWSGWQSKLTDRQRKVAARLYLAWRRI